MRWFILLLLPFSSALADDAVTICYNYGCNVKNQVVFDIRNLERIGELFTDIEAPEIERGSIQLAMGLMARIAGEQTPTRNDRGGNFADDGVEGRMDCIDHSHNATTYLHLIQHHGWLKYHTVLTPIKRAPYLLDEHWAARIEEIASGEQYIVDSWFFDNGEPAAIIPLQEWMRGAEPNG